MDKSDLAKLMLEWEEAQKKADELKANIVDAIFVTKKTEVAGNVTASYFGGKRTFEYESVARKHPGFKRDMTRTYIKKVDWKKICEILGIKEIPFTKSAPSVSLKIK